MYVILLQYMYHVNRALYLFSIFKACCIHVHVALEIDGGILILSGNVVNGFLISGMVLLNKKLKPRLSCPFY